MMKERKKERRAILRLCLITEVTALVVFLAIALVIQASTKSSVQKKEQEEMNLLTDRISAANSASAIYSPEEALIVLRSTIVELVTHDKAFRDNFAIAMCYQEHGGEGRMFQTGSLAVLTFTNYEELPNTTEPEPTDLDLSDQYYETGDGQYIVAGYPFEGPIRRWSYYTWDLWTMFPEEDNQKVIRSILEDREKKQQSPVVKEIRGRKKDDEMLYPTRVTIRQGGYEYILQSGEFLETDEVLWDIAKLSSYDTDEINTNLLCATQNDELCNLLKDQFGETWSSENYRKFYRESGESVFGELENAAIVNACMEAYHGITCDSHTYTPGVLIDYIRIPSDVVVFAIFDEDNIVRTEVRKPLIVAFAFAQTGAFLVMILAGSARRRKKERKRLRDMFVNAMAHELKTPVSVVRNTAEYLSTGAKPEKQDHYLGVLERESGSMESLLNRMLTYTQVMDGRIELNKKETDWNELTDRVIDSYSDLIAEKGMKVEFTQRTTEKTVCDPDLMGMVIDNLISNAVRHGEPGSTIIMRTEGKAFSVWNKAEALTEAELASIWTPMYATNRRSKDSETGGMGLAISAGVLDRHGAAYDAHNENDGLLFGFDFSKVNEVERGRKYAWINLITVTLDLLAATAWGMMYITREQKSFFWLMLCWLGLSILQAFVYTRSLRGTRRKMRRTRRALTA
ncbi:MAG: HAMP domain-containing histidine kinase [Lachnospiraceae bacterium]|nr:HAMP domain-containing histidine kinase [Lachnospiraceae bacterium]